MIYSKTFTDSLLHMSDTPTGRHLRGISERVANFCNEKNISKSQIVACEIFYVKDKQVQAELIWEEIEV